MVPGLPGFYFSFRPIEVLTYLLVVFSSSKLYKPLVSETDTGTQW